MHSMAVSSFKIPLIKKVPQSAIPLRGEKNSSGAWNFYFRKPKGFVYTAGQYIKMKLEIKNPDDRGTTRYFTLSSSPTEEHLAITTKIIKSSFKKRLAELKIGEKVHIRGPWGDFVLPENNTPVVFIAGGIGMTPYRSMIKFASDKNLKNPITLIVSYKTEEQILYKQELEEIKRNHKNIKVVIVTERINTDLLQKSIDSLEDNLYYIAGPEAMIEGLEKTLLGMGISKDKMLTDGFPGYKI